MSSETNPPESRARALQFDNSSDCRQRRLVGVSRRFGHLIFLPPGSVSWAANNTGVYRGRITKVRFVTGTAGSSKPWGNVFKGLGTEPGRKHPGYARTCHNIVVHKYVRAVFSGTTCCTHNGSAQQLPPPARGTIADGPCARASKHVLCSYARTHVRVVCSYTPVHGRLIPVFVFFVPVRLLPRVPGNAIAHCRRR